MPTDFEGLDLSRYQAMAGDWRDRRSIFERTHLQLRGNTALARRIDTLAQMSRHRSTWGLAVATAAFAAEPLSSPELTEHSALLGVVDALNTRGGRLRLDGFAGFASEVTQLPASAFIREGPRLGRILRLDPAMTAAAFICADYCLSEHPNDYDAYLRCVVGCGG